MPSNLRSSTEDDIEGQRPGKKAFVHSEHGLCQPIRSLTDSVSSDVGERDVGRVGMSVCRTETLQCVVS